MKRVICNIFAFCILLVSTNSCLTSMLVYEYATVSNMLVEQQMTDISKTKTKLKLHVIQTHTPFEGLATTPNYDVVKVRTVTDEIYDGKNMKGKFIRVDTYTYTTKNGDIKTVPVFVPSKEYKYYNRLISSDYSPYL